MPSARARRPVWLLYCVWLAVLLLGCAYTRSPETPMGQIHYGRLGAQRADGAIVLLPGFGDRPETFAERGFLAAVRRQAPQYDVIAADAHFGYYRKHCLVERLERDVIGPLVREGYRELWLVGTSMGGFGAVAYARQHPERIAGILLFAPYMGPANVVAEVKRAGLCSFRPNERVKVEDQESFARANFAYLGRTARLCPRADPRASTRAREVALFLAVGKDDSLFAADETLAKALPSDHFLALPGGHGWKVWTPAVEQLAARAFRERALQPVREYPR